MKLCRACKTNYEPTQHQLKKGDYICRNCRQEYDAKWREARKTKGLKTGGGSMPLAYYQKYHEKYYADPQHRKRRAERAKRYRNDPLLRMKHEARWQANRALKSGFIVRQPCQVCGKVKAEMHHKDYYQPLKVIWLCRRDHKIIHTQTNGEAP